MLCEVMGELNDDTSCAQSQRYGQYQVPDAEPGKVSTSTCLFSSDQQGQHAKSGVGHRPSSLTAVLHNSSPLMQHNSGNFNQIAAQQRMVNNLPHTQCFRATQSQKQIVK